MNLLEQVKMCQYYIMFVKLHHEKSRITSRRKNRRIAELNSEKQAKILYAPRQNLYALRHFGADFEALPKVQIEPKIGNWKSLPVYFPTQVEFLNLDVIFPSKTSIYQDCFLCVKIGAVRSFFECF